MSEHGQARDAPANKHATPRPTSKRGKKDEQAHQQRRTSTPTTPNKHTNNAEQAHQQRRTSTPTTPNKHTNNAEQAHQQRRTSTPTTPKRPPPPFGDGGPLRSKDLRRSSGPSDPRTVHLTGRDHLLISVTRPEPTVRPPSRIAKPRPGSIAIG